MSNPLNITDQFNRKIILPHTPSRVVSLVPSVSFLLYLLGLENEVAGITRFCKYPKHWKKEKTIVGGTKDPKIERIAGLKPELIIANKEENTKESVEKLEKIAPVYVSDVHDLKSNNAFISDMGKIFHKEEKSNQIISQIEFLHQELIKNQNKTYKSLYFIWREPWMSIGGDTFISYMMQLAGFDNVLKSEKRYPVVDLQKLQRLNPEVILLSSEPFPFKEKHREELQKIFPNSQILLVKGEAFTWFGAYPLFAFPYLYQLQQKIQS